MKRFDLLEPLRGLAALWVLLFHHGYARGTEEACPTLLQLAHHGHLGVPMFFVISGICIATAAKASIVHNRPTREFVARRLRRIYPPFWFSIALVAALPFAIELLSSLKTGRYVSPDAAHANLGFLHYSALDWLSVASLARVFQPSPGAGSLQAKFTSISAVYWTLAIEVQFYLVAAFALWWRRGFYAVLAGVTAFAFASLAVPGIATSGIFLPYWPMFALGVLLFELFDAGIEPSRLWGSRAIAVSSVAVGLMIPLIVGALLAFPEVNHLAAAGVFAVLVFFAKGLDPAFSRMLRSQVLFSRALVFPLVGLGAMSYSVYLLHGRLQFLVAQVARQAISTDALVFDVAVILGTLVLCIPFYWLCERPFIGGSSRVVSGGSAVNAAQPQPQFIAS